MLIARDITECRETKIKMERQVQQLSILRSIDLAIASGLDLNLLLSMLLDRVMALMHVDAATVLLMNSKTNLLSSRQERLSFQYPAVYAFEAGGRMCRPGGPGARNAPYL